MLHPNVRDTMASIDAALEAAKREPPEPTIVEGNYYRDLDLFIFKISDGRRLVIPREDLQATSNATPEQAADFEIGPNRVNVWWPQLDEGILLEPALEGRYGNDAWMDHVHRRTNAAA